MEIAGFMQTVRRMKLAKTPGVAETLDWRAAPATLHAAHLDDSVVRETLGCFLKYESDLRLFQAERDMGRLVATLGAVG